jgi:hypothetical protein
MLFGRNRFGALLLGVAFVSLVGPCLAYDISASATNTTGSAKQGEKLTLYGGQPILTQVSTNPTYNTFTPRAPIVSATQTTLNYGTNSIANGSPAGIFVRTGTSSALVKSWTWTDAAFNSLASIPALSGSIIAAASPVAASPGSVSALAVEGPQRAYWTFYNGTKENQFIESMGFFYEERSSQRTVRIASSGPRALEGEDFATGARVAGFFGGARLAQTSKGEALFIPPRGGIVFLLEAAAPPQDPGAQLWAHCGCVVSKDGVAGTVGYDHANQVPDQAGTKAREPRNSPYWRNEIGLYRFVQMRPLSDLTAVRVAYGDVGIGRAQVWLNELTNRYPELQNPQVIALLATPVSLTDIRKQAKVELAAVLLNRSAELLFPDDRVNLGSRVSGLDAVVDQCAAWIAGGRVEDHKEALRILKGINTRIIPVLPP